MSIGIHLQFTGQCREAFEFYQSLLGGSLEVLTYAESNRLFEALAEGGEVLMPVQKTFWSPCYGMLKDRFGMPWEVNCAE